jgi:hypothetical protein
VHEDKYPHSKNQYKTVLKLPNDLADRGTLSARIDVVGTTKQTGRNSQTAEG